MTEPTEAIIQQIKAANPDRAIHQVEMKPVDSDETFYFLMKGANADEYDKFNNDILVANNAKESERRDQIRLVTKNAALRQIVWPEREETKAILFNTPGLLILFPDEIHKHAGSTAEVRSRKL